MLQSFRVIQRKAEFELLDVIQHPQRLPDHLVARVVRNPVEVGQVDHGTAGKEVVEGVQGAPISSLKGFVALPFECSETLVPIEPTAWNVAAAGFLRPRVPSLLSLAPAMVP
eukprot:scaffold7412_cov449-Pinguiococcus_pyrenoidosus.AAC.1